MGITLLPCQQEAADAFVKMGGRQYLSAKVGHGKSYVAAECIRRSQAKYPAPALYLTTTTAIKEQVQKFQDFGLEVVVVPSQSVKRVELWKQPQNVVYVANLEVVGCPESEWKVLRYVPFGCIVVDEADRLTGSASKRNKRLIQLPARHRLLMSGTVLRNGLKDAFFPLMWLPQTPTWRNWTDFNQKELLHQNPMLPHMITGIRDQEHLASLLRPYMHTMTNPDAPTELVAEIITVHLSPEEREVYEKMKDELIWEAEQGTLTISNQAVLNLRLRQCVAMPEALNIKLESSKEKKLLELLTGLEGKHLIFTSFASVADILAQHHGWPCITGKMSAKARQAILATEPDILIATSAAERGVDCAWLTNVISLDQGYTPATMRQRAGRATRYGRTGDAKLYLLQAKDTVDITSEARIILSKLRQIRKVLTTDAKIR